MLHSLCIPALVIFNIFLYGRTLRYGLVIDDIDWYKHWDDQWYRTSLGRGYANMSWYNWIHPQTIFLSLYGAASLYAFNKNLRNYKLDHSITLTLHIITALLLCSYAGPIAALLFSCHPCNHQTSIWLTGRRYSIINIIFLVLLLTHTIFLIIPLSLLIARHYYHSIRNRIKRSVPTGTYTPTSILRTILFSIGKLLGHPIVSSHYSFRYPYHNTAPYLPCTQPVAERYLSVPLILTCILLSHIPLKIIIPTTTITIPFIWLIMPLYAFKTCQLIPMYHNIQSFYDYHRRLYPNLEKLTLIKKLYPEIKIVP